MRDCRGAFDLPISTGLAMKTILITGGCGFIGSNFVRYVFAKYPEYQLVNLDKLTYAGELSNLKQLQNHKNYSFVKGDICDTELVNELFKKHSFSGVIHFAAESHVDNSISNPDAFIKTKIQVFTSFSASNFSPK